MPNITKAEYYALQAKQKLFLTQKELESGVEREADLHDQISEHCRRKGWIAYHGSMTHPTHRTGGEPDFIIQADDGKVFFVECKSRSGKLSPNQQALILHAKHLWHTIHVVRNFEQFLEVVSK